MREETKENDKERKRCYITDLNKIKAKKRKEKKRERERQNGRERETKMSERETK